MIEITKSSRQKRKFFFGKSLNIYIPICILSLTVSSLLAADKDKVWNILPGPADGGTYSIENLDGNKGFRMTLRRASGSNAYATAVMNVNRAMPSQDKLLFSYRNVNENAIYLTPVISYKENGKLIVKNGPKLSLKGTKWKNYVMSLDTDFQMGDALFNISQLKFVANISILPTESEASVEIKDIRLLSVADVNFTPEKQTVIVSPKPSNAESNIARDKNPVKIFFHLDNEDLSTVFRSTRQPAISDNCQYAGFREMLLDTVKGKLEITENIDSADLIVYSSATPDSETARKIASAVKNGKALFATSSVVDPEIAELLPVTIAPLPEKGYPERQTLKTLHPHPVMTDGGLNDAAFGKYSYLTRRPDAKDILEFADDTPAVLEGKAGNGKVIYSCFTLGADLIPGKTAYDAFFIRVAGYLANKKFKEENAIRPKSVNGFYEGAGKENFGRFGWLVGDGLLAESISNTLSVINGSQEYAFSSSLTPQLMLLSWTFKPLSGEIADQKNLPSNIDWTYHWRNTGKIELLCKCTVPSSWKDEQIFFHVEKGIDDLAEVYFNGRLIGRVTSDTPNYWMAPHLYKVSPEYIKFDGENTVRIVTENLRSEGCFGSCPEMIVKTGTAGPQKLVVDRINWLGKGGVITDASSVRRRFDTSLAFPGIRWEIFGTKINMTLYNVADFAAYSTSAGIKVVDLHKTKSVPVDWNAPWLLLFKNSTERPLLLVFEHKMDTIVPQLSGDNLNGITLEADNHIGTIIPIWLYGRETVDSSSWENGLPDGVMERIKFWYPKSFSFPVSCREEFSIDDKTKRVNIKDTYTYKKTKDDWSTKTAPYAPVSPLAFFMKGTLFESDQVEDWKLVTGYGNYAARNNSDIVEWSLPLEEPVLSQIPHVTGRPDLELLANSLFKDGNRWSCGGYTKFTDWTPVYPLGKKLPECRNMSMYEWSMGIGRCLNAPYIYNDENIEAIKTRTRIRFFEPVERFQYKMATRWREEPFSGIRYPIYFNSFYIHGTKFEKGIGSILNYGDQNEASYTILSLFQQLADKYGQAELILANKNLIAYTARMLFASDDWGYMACHCRESGGSASIDMLNCEYAAMMILSRLAEVIGEPALRAQALYRASRRMVPTLARLKFKDYAVEHHLIDYPENLLAGVGFGEEGPAFKQITDVPAPCHLFDMSQEIPPDLIELYKKYAAKEIGKYFENIMPLYNKDEMKSTLSFSMVDVIGRLAGLSSKNLNNFLMDAVDNKRMIHGLKNDWGGICVGASIDHVLFNMTGSEVSIYSAKKLDIKSAFYHPDKKLLHLEFAAGKDSSLILHSRLELADGKYARDKNGFIKVETRLGNNYLDMSFK